MKFLHFLSQILPARLSINRSDSFKGKSQINHLQATTPLSFRT